MLGGVHPLPNRSHNAGRNAISHWLAVVGLISLWPVAVLAQLLVDVVDAASRRAVVAVEAASAT
jgi:hypothetical protein